MSCETSNENTTGQDETIQFLSRGADTGLSAKRIDTHGAVVFLIGEQAFKIKRQVKYDYMDLSTLDKRHALLEREFELNHPTAPSIYREVIPLVRSASGDLSLGGPGEITEWVLSMNRFPEEAELTNIAKKAVINDSLADSLGRSVARYHDAAPIRQLDASVLIKEILEELDRVLTTMGSVFGDDAKAFVRRCLQTWNADLEHLANRSARGFVRRCHGDLHLRNIVMIDGIPTPFDALEFDERLGTCDTLYDLAFLLMDLEHLGMRHSANVVLNSYLEQDALGASNYGLRHLPLYLSIRAAIRAMVDVQSAEFSSDGEKMTKDARTYMRQALRYLDPARPMLVAIGGYSGTGKTTIARAVAHIIGAAPGAIITRSDVVRKTLLQCDPLERLGPEGYVQEVTARTYKAMRKQAGHILHQGHSVILDGVHGTSGTRHTAEEVAKSVGVPFCGFWLEAAVKARAARVTSRGPDASDADVHVVHRQSKADPGSIHWHQIDADQSTEAVVADVKEVLREFDQVAISGPIE